MALKNIKTPCGFEARVDEDALNDLDVYDALQRFYAAAEEGRAPDVRGACVALLGEAGFRAFGVFERKHFGRVRVDHAGEVIAAVMEALDSKKK